MKQFKRIISLVIAMTMLVSMFSVGMVSASAETQSYMLGDVNFDGSVTIFDATAIQRSVAKFVGYEIEEGSIKFAAADVNGDEKVSIFDATLIQQFVAHFATVMEYGIGDTFTFGEVVDPSEDESSEVESSETPSSSEDESSEVESSETPSSEDESSETPSSEEESSETPSSEEESSEAPSSEEESSEAPSSEEPSSEEPSSEEPSEDVLTAGYYMVGIFNGEDCWDADKLTADRKLAENPDAAGEYILYWTFVGGDELKVAHFDGEKFDALYKVEAEPSYMIGATSDKTGYCSVKFNPAGRSDWSYTYLTVKRAEKPVDPTDKPTDAPSSETPSSDVPSSETPSSETPEELVAGYYLVGMLNGVDCWSVDALTTDRLLKANPATAGEYMLDWTFVGGDELKVAHFDGVKFDKWFNDGGENYKIGATSNKVGPGTIYFRPEGNADWSYNFFTVQPRTVDPTDKPTDAPSSEEESSEAPSSEEPSSEEESSETPSSEEESSEEPSSSETPSSEEESSETPSSEEPSSEEESSEAPSSEEPSSEEESSETPSSEEPTEPTTEETKLEVGYYLVGMLNGVDCWSVDALTADRLLKANPATAGEYMLDWTFVGGDEIKVAHFDGEKFDKWFNDGGDNYIIGATSNKVGPGTIYFRPEGNADWSYNFFTVQPKTVDPTEKPTEAPSSEEESSETPSSEEESSEAPSSEEPSSEEESSEAPTEKPTEAPTYVAYFVNSGKWSKVNAYAWDPTNAAWPGQAMTKTADKAPNGADVYTITFKTNYANIIFNDGSSQTTDLKFQAGQYFDYATGKWYAKLSDIPAAAVTGYTVYCVNSKNWSTVNCYVWGPNGASWPGAKMTKTGEKSSKGYDIYSFNSVQNHTNCIFNNGSGSQTADLKFTAGQYFDLATGKWYADASTI